jgi:predicted small lipoprotein YifL
MSETRLETMRAWTLCGLLGLTVALGGCGQRGALYLPDRNARVVTRPATASQQDGQSSAPASTQPAGSAPN